MKFLTIGRCGFSSVDCEGDRTNRSDTCSGLASPGDRTNLFESYSARAIGAARESEEDDSNSPRLPEKGYYPEYQEGYGNDELLGSRAHSRQQG